MMRRIKLVRMLKLIRMIQLVSMIRLVRRMNNILTIIELEIMVKSITPMHVMKLLRMM